MASRLESEPVDLPTIDIRADPGSPFPETSIPAIDIGAPRHNSVSPMVERDIPVHPRHLESDDQPRIEIIGVIYTPTFSQPPKPHLQSQLAKYGITAPDTHAKDILVISYNRAEGSVTVAPWVTGPTQTNPQNPHWRDIPPMLIDQQSLTPEDVIDYLSKIGAQLPTHIEPQDIIFALEQPQTVVSVLAPAF